jgi:hypothetical protein
MSMLTYQYIHCVDPNTIGNYGMSGGGNSSAEAIYNEAKLSPLNQSPTMVGWESLSKVLDLDFIKGGIGQRVAAKCKL